MTQPLSLFNVLIPFILMPPPVSQRQRIVLIDEEWASTLIGLPMQMPNSWWNGYNKNNKTLNVGTIVGVNFDAPQSNYFQLECVGEIYVMQYDAVYLYADVNHANYKKYSLPPDAPTNPENEDEVIAPVQKKRTKIAAWRLDDDGKDNDKDDDAANDYFATPKRNNKPGK